MKLKEPGDRPPKVWSAFLKRIDSLKAYHLVLLAATAFIVGLGLASRVKSYIWRPIVVPVAAKAARSYVYVTQFFLRPTELQIDIKHEIIRGWPTSVQTPFRSASCSKPKRASCLLRSG